MLKTLENYLIKFEYPEESHSTFISCLNDIIQDAKANAVLIEIIENYKATKKLEGILEKIPLINEQIKGNEYTTAEVIFSLLTKPCLEFYKSEGLSEELWFDTMQDLKYNMLHCKDIKGIWGTFVAPWHIRFFEMTIFKLGRLQFEIVPFDADEFRVGDKVIKRGEKVINVHIPRTLTSLSPEACEDAYSKAANFFADELKGLPTTFVCFSWLLYHENKDILPEYSNIRKFMLRYEHIYTDYDPEGERRDAWRLFDMDYTGNVDDFPEDTSVRRAYKEHMKKGGKTGCSYGAFFYNDCSLLKR